jgi:hypothetical protein
MTYYTNIRNVLLVQHKFYLASNELYLNYNLLLVVRIFWHLKCRNDMLHSDISA